MKKQPPCPTEYQEQCAVIFWSRVNSINDKRLLLLHGDSSGVRVSIGTALKMKKAGAIKGWPDLFLPVPKIVESQKLFVDHKWQLSIHNGFYGLFIELKRQRGGVVSKEQKEIHELLREQGYRVEVAKGAEEAIRVISEYLGL